MLNPFPIKPWFLQVCSLSLLKTLWEKVKLLITSNFSFSHSLFYPFRKLSAILINFKTVVCKLFQFLRVKSLLFRKGLTLSQTTNFRLFQLERDSRRQFQILYKWQKVAKTGRKHCGKRRNCSLRAISPFPSVFKRIVLLTCKNLGLFGKGLIVLSSSQIAIFIPFKNKFYQLEQFQQDFFCCLKKLSFRDLWFNCNLRIHVYKHQNVLQSTYRSIFLTHSKTTKIWPSPNWKHLQITK